MLSRFANRLNELSNQKQSAQFRFNQAMADINAIDGAMQEIQHWMAMLEGEKDDASENKTEGDS